MQYSDRVPGERRPWAARPPPPVAGNPAVGADEDVLVGRARHGDERAFAELVRRHQPRLLRLARRRVRCRAGADDVVQLTLLRVLQALPRYEPLGKFRAYLQRVLDNQCRMANRSQGARDRALQRSVRAEGEPVWSPDRELYLSTAAAVRLLTQLQRQVLALRALQGFTFQETGSCSRRRRRRYAAATLMPGANCARRWRVEPEFTALSSRPCHGPRSTVRTRAASVDFGGVLGDRRTQYEIHSAASGAAPQLGRSSMPNLARWTSWVAVVCGLACTSAESGQPALSTRGLSQWLAGAGALPSHGGHTGGFDAGASATRDEWVGALALPLIEGEWLEGVSIALVSDGGVETYGYGALRDGGPVPDGRTLFEIGSITKTFTSLLLADLVRDGSVELDQPVATRRTRSSCRSSCSSMPPRSSRALAPTASWTTAKYSADETYPATRL